MGDLRYAIVGVGGEGRHHLNAAKRNPHVEVAAVVDVDETAARAAAATHDVPWFTDHRTMLDTVDIDLASAALPHDLYAPIVGDLMAGGIHTIAEKPLATRISVADQLIAAAEESGVHLGVRLQYRQFAINRIVHDLVADGAVGDLRRVLWLDRTYRPLSYFERGEWRMQWERVGGGVMLSHYIHHVDVLNWILGRQPDIVTAIASRTLHPYRLEDALSAALAYDDGLVVTWQTDYNEPWWNDRREFAGERGIITVDHLAHDALDLPARIRHGTYDGTLTSHLGDELHSPESRMPISWKTIQRAVPQHRVMDLIDEARRQARRVRRRLPIGQPTDTAPGWTWWFDDFVDAVRADSTSSTTALDARNAIEVINAMYLASATGRHVELPLDPEEYDHFHDRLVAGEIEIGPFGPVSPGG